MDINQPMSILLNAFIADNSVIRNNAEKKEKLFDFFTCDADIAKLARISHTYGEDSFRIEFFRQLYPLVKDIVLSLPLNKTFLQEFKDIPSHSKPYQFAGYWLRRLQFEINMENKVEEYFLLESESTHQSEINRRKFNEGYRLGENNMLKA